MFKSKLHRRLPVVTAFMAVSIMAVGVAFAAWTATGSGTGEATAGEAVDLDIEPISAGTLYPTVTVDLTVDVVNPNPYNVQVDQIDLGTAGITVDAGACNAGDITWNGPFSYDTDEFVVGAEDSQEVTLSGALTMGNDAHDDCQNAEFTVNLDLSGASTGSGPADPGAE